jgi:adenine-specific DNA-methyltransferase
VLGSGQGVIAPAAVEGEYVPTLDWMTRETDVRAAGRVPYRLLEAVPNLDGGDGDAANMLIQGDNLDALKALLPYYAGRVKCIYIDPPYNTRSAFDHYDDNLEHSQWLAMIYPRLVLLRDLLAEDGSIWVSIDDNEGHYLKVAMDEVFGRRNFLTTFIWKKVDSPNDNKVAITPDHEFVLCYEKVSEAAGFQQQTAHGILGAYGSRDEEGRLYRDRLLKKNGKSSLRSDRPTMFFGVEAPDGTMAWPIHDDGREARWSMSPSGVERVRQEGRLKWKRRLRLGEEVWVPYVREYAPAAPTRPHFTILTDVKTSRQAKAHQRQLLPDSPPFDTVKPEELMERIIGLGTQPGDLVLDSFLGSGTTAAVAHKMGRRWIGIEMGDHAVTHCKPRLDKVIAGEQGGVSETVGWTGGGGYRFYRLGDPVFDADGHISDGIRFTTLAAHIWFSETGTPFTGAADSPVLGVHGGTAYALLYNGILRDRSISGGNVLTAPLLASLRQASGWMGPMVVYGEASRLGAARLKDESVTFKQTPYDVRAR